MVRPSGTAPSYLLGLRLVTQRLPEERWFPFDLPFLQGDFSVAFSKAVTFFVGENGTGKSTLLEAIAALSNLPISGGSRSELGTTHGPEVDSRLADALRPSFRNRPRDGFFLRAEFHAHFASLLDKRSESRDFLGDPYARYGGRSLHARSHGESFLALIKHRFRSGLFLLDEPEAALSPQRQLSLLALMASLVAAGETQFIVATHSPILLTYPGSEILSFDSGPPKSVTLEETAHYQITKGILEAPTRYWKHLLESSLEQGT